MVILDLTPIKDIETDGAIFSIAGTKYYEKTVKNLKENTKVYLVLEKNKFDSYSIVIMTKDKQKCGYVPSLLTALFKRVFKQREDGVLLCICKIYKIKDSNIIVYVKSC